LNGAIDDVRIYNRALNADEILQLAQMRSASSSRALAVVFAGSGAGTVTSSPAGISCQAGCTAAFDPGSSVTLTAAAGSGSQFSGWGGTCAGNAPTCTVALDTDISVTASFATGPQTYYVDFDHGNDANNGQSAALAWQHAPGDPAAQGGPAMFLQYGSKTLVPGDIIKFKGGVVYRGQVKPVYTSCVKDAEGQGPVTYLGQSDYGTGKAVLDGTIPITGWQRCQSAEECGGNPHYARIWYALADSRTKTLKPLSVAMFQNDEPLFIAQSPNLPDPAVIDDIVHYFTIPQQNVISNLDQNPNYTSIIDPRLEAMGGEKLIGSYVVFWEGNNVVKYLKVLNYTPSLYWIDFEWDSESRIYRDRDNKYSIVNNLFSALDAPGEFYFNETAEADGSRKVYLWPLGKDTDVNQQKIEISVLSTGFYPNANCSTVIDGFKIQKFFGNGIQTQGKDIIRNNDLKSIGSPMGGNSAALQTMNALVERNTLYAVKGTRGIMGVGVIRNNSLEKIDGTAILALGAFNNVAILDNTIL
ncbi:MAG: hypothetical protein WCI27_12035, partial [Candidatus Omnitrophota bacterium]